MKQPWLVFFFFQLTAKLSLQCIALRHNKIYDVNKLPLLLSDYSKKVNLIELKKKIPTQNINSCNPSRLKSCTVAKINFSVLNMNKFDIHYCKNMVRTTKFITHPMRSVENGTETKSALYENKEGCQAYLTLSGHFLMAVVTVPGTDDFFTIDPCNAFKHCHVWKEEIVDKRPKASDVIVLPLPTSRILPLERSLMDLRKKGIMDSTNYAEFTVKFYYNQEFKKNVDNIDMYFQEIMMRTNQGFANSNIPVLMKLHPKIEEVKFKEGNFSYRSYLERFSRIKGKIPAKLLDGADIASLMIEKTNNACGITWLAAWRFGEPFTVQTRECARNELTFAHEIGHIFGCVHNRKNTNVKPANIPYKYGHGTYIKNKHLRTIMAYPRNVHDKPILYYSSDTVKYKGKSIGGTSMNCARVIRENRFAVAGLSESRVIHQKIPPQ